MFNPLRRLSICVHR